MQAQARCLAVHGDADCAGVPLVPGLTVAQVDVCDAVSCARSMIADPYLFQHLQTGTTGPHCVFCNACIARAGRLRVDCYHPAVRKEKDLMLAEQNNLNSA